MPDVFISHATKDDAVVGEIRRALEGQGLSVWVDSRELAGGDPLEREVRDAISGARHFLAVLSPAAVSSAWVRKEIEYARQVQKERGAAFRVIPILLPGIEPSALPLWFGEEPVGIKIALGPGGVQAALPDLLAALGVILPADHEPAHRPAAVPLADLVLALQEPTIEVGEERASAVATLSYRPADGSPAVVSPRFRFTAPLGAIEAGEIDWYLERYVRWPSEHFKLRADQVEKDLPRWGQLLYSGLSVEAARLALQAWRSAIGSRRFTVEVDSEPLPSLADAAGDEARRALVAEAATAFLVLPWELLHDGQGYLFQGPKGVRVRRRLPNRHPREPLSTAAPLRVLLVSPRPEDEFASYIDHRVSARPLAEALDALGSLASLKILAPPTFPALVAELLRGQEAGKPYQVVHFDGHGVYDRRHGLGALCFELPEDEEKLDFRRSEIVGAERLAEVVRDHRVPLVFLEACQSAMTKVDPTASVASRLLQGGVASVAAMSHSVLVETARRFVGVFYSRLAAGKLIGEAMLAGQRALKDDPFRGRTFTGDLHLQDWFVPVLFQEEADPQLVFEVPPAAVQAALAESRRRELGALPAEPPHQFVGRSRDLLRAERLLARERYVVLCGEGGGGKSTLAVELARWLVATERAERVAFASLEHERNARNLLRVLGEQLVPGLASEAANDKERATKLLERTLGEGTAILLIDNVESVLTPPGVAVTSNEVEALAEIIALIARLGRVGQTRLIFTSRELLPAPFDQNHQTVGRLDREEAMALVDKVLRESGLHPRADDAGESDGEIEALVETAQGHTQFLVLLARDVARDGGRWTTVDLQKLMARLEAKHPGDRERSLFANVEVSLRRLVPRIREKIRPLGVFQGGGHLGVIAQVLGLDTKNNEEIALADQLVGVGLATRLPYNYLLLHPALGPALLAEIDAKERKSVQAHWVEATVMLVGFLYQLRSSDPKAAFSLTLLDLPNLLTVIEELASGSSTEQVIGVAYSLEILLANLGRPKALARVTKVREMTFGRLAAWGHASYLAQAAALDRLLAARRSAEAVAAARALLAEAEAAGEGAFPEAANDIAMCYTHVGQALKESGNAGAALSAYAEAGRRFRRLVAGGDASAAHMASRVLGPTGDCLRDLGRLDEAVRTYEEAIEQAEVRDIAVGKGQLGTVRLLQERFAEALAAFHEARETFKALGEPGSVSAAWHQIGRVHEAAKETEAAESAYLNSLEIKFRERDRSGQALTLGQLANLYQGMKRLEDSIRFLRLALEIYLDLRDLANEGRVRNNMASSYLDLGRKDEARRELLQAIQCLESYGNSGESWKAFFLLESLERAAGDADAARVARSKAIQAYLAYRRDGGESTAVGGKLCSDAAQALTRGEEVALSETISDLLERPDLPTQGHAVLSTLQAVLAGSRDPSLADDPSLDFRDAAELRLLLEGLAGAGEPAID